MQNFQIDEKSPVHKNKSKNVCVIFLIFFFGGGVFFFVCFFCFLCVFFFDLHLHSDHKFETFMTTFSRKMLCAKFTILHPPPKKKKKSKHDTSFFVVK